MEGAYPTNEALDSFNLLIFKLVKPLVLAVCQPRRTYMIDTDTTANALWFAMLTIIGRPEMRMSLHSRNPTPPRYTVL